MKEEQREAAARASELAGKRETISRLEEAVGRRPCDLAAELTRIEAEIGDCGRRCVEEVVRVLEAVERAGQVQLRRGIAHLQCRAVESENSETKEKLEELKRYRL